jgi:hypothetical protein
MWEKPECPCQTASTHMGDRLTYSGDDSFKVQRTTQYCRRWENYEISQIQMDEVVEGVQSTQYK